MQTFPVARIDLAALKHNLQQVRHYAPESQVMAVIKANAYGHGVFEVARALEESDAFAVARLSEGLLLRRNGIGKPIVILEGVSDLNELELAAKHKLSPVIHHQHHLELFSQIATSDKMSFCWLMVETGMHRLGIAAEQVEQALSVLARSQVIDGPIGLMSHFANADSIGDVRNESQLTVMLQLAEQTGLEVCMANSAALISLSQSQQQWVRPGLMLYGVSPFDDKCGEALGLKPAMQLVSSLIAVYALKAGDEVGYGGTWRASKDQRVGVVSIGYGDGYSRHLSAKGHVIIHGIKLPVIGRVSMDTICIDLSACPDAAVGDEVVLWGHERLPVEQVAQQIGTIAYEPLSVLAERVRREYHYG